MSLGVIGRIFSSSSLSKRETSEMDRNNRIKSVKIELAPPENSEEPKPELKLLFIDLNGFPPSVQFVLCSSGVFFFYLIYAYVQVCLSPNNIWFHRASLNIKLGHVYNKNNNLVHRNVDPAYFFSERTLSFVINVEEIGN